MRQPRISKTGPRYASCHPEEPQAVLSETKEGTFLGLASNDSRISFQKHSSFAPIIAYFCIFWPKTRFIIGHCVMRPFVFIHIPGGSFIFNISMGLRHFSDIDQREPPQWAQIGVLHPLHKHRAFVVRSHQDGVILG
jgi:hypothetical protein